MHATEPHLGELRRRRRQWKSRNIVLAGRGDVGKHHLGDDEIVGRQLLREPADIVGVRVGVVHDAVKLTVDFWAERAVERSKAPSVRELDAQVVYQRVKPAAGLKGVAPDRDGLRLGDERRDGDARLLGRGKWPRRHFLHRRRGDWRRRAFVTLVEAQHVLQLRLAGNEFRSRSILADVGHLAHADGLLLVDLLASVVVDDRLAAAHLVLLAGLKEVGSVAEGQLAVVLVNVHDIHWVVAHEDREGRSLDDVDEHVLRRLAVGGDAQRLRLVCLLRPEVVRADRHRCDVLRLGRSGDRARLAALEELNDFAAHGVAGRDEVGLAAEALLPRGRVVHVAVEALVLLGLH